MPFTNFPAKEISRGLQAVPTSLTDIPGATKDTYIFQLVVSNTTAGALTFTLQDKQGSPLKLYNAVSLAASSQPIVFQTEEHAILMSGGAQWQASGPGLVAEVVATVKS